MALKGIMRSENSHSQKVTYCMIPFIQYSWNLKNNYRDVEEIRGCQELERVRKREVAVTIKGDPGDPVMKLSVL